LKRPGLVAGLFLLMYAFGRTVVENFRMPDSFVHGMPEWLTMGQLLSIPMWLGGAWLVWNALKSKPTSDGVTLKDRLIRLIETGGPIPVSTFMQLCLHDKGAGLLRDAPRHRERLHHRARDQPDLRGTDRPVAGTRVEGAGVTGGNPHRRDRPRPRRPDAGRAAPRHGGGRRRLRECDARDPRGASPGHARNPA
jgi:hypothetical protein